MSGKMKCSRRHRAGYSAIKLPARSTGADLQFAALVFLAVLAYPKPDEKRKREKFVMAVKALVAKRFIAAGGNKKTIQTRFRSYPNDRLYRTGPIQNAIKRLRNLRFPAAEILRWQLTRIALKQTLGISTSINVGTSNVNSINSAAHAIAKWRKSELADVESEKRNIVHRAWQGSKPVVHLALAFMQNATPTDDLLDFILHPEWLESTLHDAEVLRICLSGLHDLNIKEGELLQLT